MPRVRRLHAIILSVERRGREQCILHGMAITPDGVYICERSLAKAALPSVAASHNNKQEFQHRGLSTLLNLGGSVITGSVPEVCQVRCFPICRSRQSRIRSSFDENCPHNLMGMAGAGCTDGEGCCSLLLITYCVPRWITRLLPARSFTCAALQRH